MSKWTVRWKRQTEPDVQECRGLTPEVALFRLRGALKESGPITVLSVQHEVAEKERADGHRERPHLPGEEACSERTERRAKRKTNARKMRVTGRGLLTTKPNEVKRKKRKKKR